MKLKNKGKTDTKKDSFLHTDKIQFTTMNEQIKSEERRIDENVFYYYNTEHKRNIKVVLRGTNPYKIKPEVKSLNLKPGRLTDTKKIYIDFGMSKTLQNERRSELVVIHDIPDKVIKNELEYKAFLGISDNEGKEVRYKPKRGRPPIIKEKIEVVKKKKNYNTNKIIFYEGTDKEKVLNIKELESFKNIKKELKKEINTMPELIEKVSKVLDKKGTKNALNKWKIEKEKAEIRLSEQIISLFEAERGNDFFENHNINVLNAKNLDIRGLWEDESLGLENLRNKEKEEIALNKEKEEDYLYLNPRLKPEEKLRIIARHKAKKRAEEEERKRQEKREQKELIRLLREKEEKKIRRKETQERNLAVLEEVLQVCKDCNKMLYSLNNRVKKNIQAEKIKSGIYGAAVLFNVNIERLSWYGKELTEEEPKKYVEAKRDILFIGDCSGRDKEFSYKLLESMRPVETLVLGREKNTIIIVEKGKNIKAYITSKVINVFLEQLSEEKGSGLIIA